MAISLFIDGAQVALKKGSSIEYVSENRIFTDADDYSLEIELPVGYFSHVRQLSSKLALRSLNRKGAECPQNIAVFGLLTRKAINTEADNAPGEPVQLRLCSDSTDSAAEVYRALGYNPRPVKAIYRHGILTAARWLNL